MRKGILVTVFVLALSQSGAESSTDAMWGSASSDHGLKCRNISSPGTAESTSDGCTSPFGCAKGTVDRGLLRGTFFATVDMIAQSAGMPTHEPASTFSLSVTRVFRPRRGGTLTVHSTGVFDPVRGVGSEVSLVTDGTGPWEGATGHLFADVEATSATTFDGFVTGTICFQ